MCSGFIGLFCLFVEYFRFKKNISYSDLRHRLSVCTGWCWCRAPQPRGAFPHTRERPRQEMSRYGAKFPVQSSVQTIHTFWSCEDPESFNNLTFFQVHMQNITCRLAAHTCWHCRTGHKSCCQKSQRSRWNHTVCLWNIWDSPHPLRAKDLHTNRSTWEKLGIQHIMDCILLHLDFFVH